MRLQSLWLLVALGGCSEARKQAAPSAAPGGAPTAPAAPAASASVAKVPATGAAETPAKVVDSALGEVAKDAAAKGGDTPAVAALPSVPDSLQRRIRYQLRELSPAPLALRDTVLLPSKNGGSEVVGFYEFSVYEDCVKRAGGSRAESRDRCLPELQRVSVGLPDADGTGGETREVRLNRRCKRYGLFYARVGPAQDPSKGSLQVMSKQRPDEEDCELVSQTLRLEDLDRDGRQEVVADMTFGREAFGDQRNGDSVVDMATQRSVWVLEVAMEPEPELRERLALSHGPRRIGHDGDARWVDLNRDGQLDLVQVLDCDGRSGAHGNDGECDIELRQRIWHLYDRELDEWRVYEPMLDPTDADPDAASAPSAEGQP